MIITMTVLVAIAFGISLLLATTLFEIIFISTCYLISLTLGICMIIEDT